MERSIFIIFGISIARDKEEKRSRDVNGKKI
jgi:hypothetical protein